MELEHAFQQSGLVLAFQLMVVTALLAPGFVAGSARFQRFLRTAVSYIISFGPMAILIYVLYRVSKLA